MNIIDSYQFGLIVVNGKNYTSDIITFSDRIKDWWRKTGRQLHPGDLSEGIAENPEVLIIGTGDLGLVKVLSEVPPSLEAEGIKLIVEPTNEACTIYNQLCHSQRIVAALHLTC